uniref:Uncharacterized protein n=1 Tax=Octopus bimaculoides TaxID=37653 RepID=A0A0L8ICI9_OCTBM
MNPCICRPKTFDDDTSIDSVELSSTATDSSSTVTPEEMDTSPKKSPIPDLILLDATVRSCSVMDVDRPEQDLPPVETVCRDLY